MRKFTARYSAPVLIATALFAVSASAGDIKDEDGVQDRGANGPPVAGERPTIPANTVFDDNWITLGIGAGISTSYSGSDDYVAIPAPLIRGKLGPVRINPRPAGFALDFLPKPERGRPGSGSQVSFELGPVVRFRNDRAEQIEDEVVELAGELDGAFEVGVTGGVSVSEILNPFDSLSFSMDARWDVAGAHKGQVISPGVSYFTPVSRAAAVSLNLGAEFVDDNFADYYFSVSPVQSDASGLPEFTAQGGLRSLGATLITGYDLDGDVTNGGLALFGVGGYSRLMNDAADTPYTSIRGSADQFFAGAGIAYTF